MMNESFGLGRADECDVISKYSTEHIAIILLLRTNIGRKGHQRLLGRKVTYRHCLSKVLNRLISDGSS
jgi:hypothetical protein